jgi:hypothetical protein
MVVHSLVDENQLVSDGMIMIMATGWFLELGGPKLSCSSGADG